MHRKLELGTFNAFSYFSLYCCVDITRLYDVTEENVSLYYKFCPQILHLSIIIFFVVEKVSLVAQ